MQVCNSVIPEGRQEAGTGESPKKSRELASLAHTAEKQGTVASKMVAED